jgi:glycosyltransferase involved in cell wall biosynthesis
MKVLFTARASLFTQPGGDTQQIVQTADTLRALDVAVDIRLRGEAIDWLAYDIVHFFNIGRPADILYALTKIKVPLVVSSIWVEYGEWDKRQGGFRGFLARRFGSFATEYFKTIARSGNGSDQLPGLSYLLNGQKKAMEKVLRQAVVVVASSTSEVKRLDATFGIAAKCHVIPLGILPLEAEIETPEPRAGVICVGRIEGLKNQLNLIRAARNAPWQLKLIGKAALNQPSYFEQCLLEATDNVEFTGWLLSEHVKEQYKSANVLVLPSYFETFGLVALEALACGCNLVLANRPDMNEIFAGKALFCDPNNPEDIRQKIEIALKLPEPHLTEAEYNRYNWRSIATEIKAHYAVVTGLG